MARHERHDGDFEDRFFLFLFHYRYLVTRGFTRRRETVWLSGSHDGRRTEMPMVTVKVIEGVFTAEQKKEMIAKITDTMVEIEGENLRPVTWVLVEEVRSGDWGIAGNGLTTADVHALQRQPAAAG
jgi:4-oxalocrotonate tautomerase